MDHGHTARLHTSIINGKPVEPSSGFHTLFAMPTTGPDSDAWLGCGASIISPTFALTAAHCFGGGRKPCSGPNRVALLMGDIELDVETGMVVPKGRYFRVEADLICNPDFDGKCSHGADIALLKLQESVPRWVKPVSLDLANSAAGNVGDSVTAMGFGLIEDERNPSWVSRQNSRSLRKVSVTVLPQESEGCARVYSGGWGCSDNDSAGAAENLEEQVCAAGPQRDTCAGDSGSPVLDASGVQVAVVSYGGGPGEKLTGPGRMCGDPDYPGVYARVSAFSDFILQHVRDLPGSNGFLSPTYDGQRPVFAHSGRQPSVDDEEVLLSSSYDGNGDGSSTDDNF